MLDSKKEVSCPQTNNCLLTGYGDPRAPSASRDPIPGLLRDWVQIFETPTASADVLGEAANIVGQSGAPDRIVGALKKWTQIHGLAGDLIDHRIGLFLLYEVIQSINIAGFDAGVATWSGGGERVLRAQRVEMCCGFTVIRLYKIWLRTTDRHP